MCAFIADLMLCIVYAFLYLTSIAVCLLLIYTVFWAIGLYRFNNRKDNNRG